MLEVIVPGFGALRLEHLVLDYTGTLAFDGKLLPKVKEKLFELSKTLRIHVLTADTFGTAQTQLQGVPVTIHILKGSGMDEQKAAYVEELGVDGVVAFGNGLNDRRMLKTARVSVAVVGREGCAVETLFNADLCVTDVVDGLDLLLNPKRLEATLKF